MLKALRACLTDKQLYKPHVNTMDQIYKKGRKKKYQASFPGHFNNGNRAFCIKEKKKFLSTNLKKKQQPNKKTPTTHKPTKTTHTEVYNFFLLILNLHFIREPE